MNPTVAASLSFAPLPCNWLWGSGLLIWTGRGCFVFYTLALSVQRHLKIRCNGWAICIECTYGCMCWDGQFVPVCSLCTHPSHWLVGAEKSQERYYFIRYTTEGFFSARVTWIAGFSLGAPVLSSIFQYCKGCSVINLWHAFVCAVS